MKLVEKFEMDFQLVRKHAQRSGCILVLDAPRDYVGFQMCGLSCCCHSEFFSCSLSLSLSLSSSLAHSLSPSLLSLSLSLSLFLARYIHH